MWGALLGSQVAIKPQKCVRNKGWLASGLKGVSGADLLLGHKEELQFLAGPGCRLARCSLHFAPGATSGASGAAPAEAAVSLEPGWAATPA